MFLYFFLSVISSLLGRSLPGNFERKEEKGEQHLPACHQGIDREHIFLDTRPLKLVELIRQS